MSIHDLKNNKCLGHPFSERRQPKFSLNFTQYCASCLSFMYSGLGKSVGLFCCLGFSGVMFLLFGRGRVSFFAVWTGAAPPQQQKKRHRTNRKNKNTHPPLAKVVLLLFGWVGVFFFGRVAFFLVCLGAWACLLFLLFGRVRADFCFCCLGGGRGGRGGGGACFVCCLGRERVCFLLFGGGREFTHLPVCLARL